MRAPRLWIVFLFLFLSSCGYRAGMGDIPSRYRVISVPIVGGDHTGQFTQELIYALSASGAFEYRNTCYDATLVVNFVEYCDEHIGFKYDRNKHGELQKSIVPAETRRKIVAEVGLIDAASDCYVVGPILITAEIEFDHDYNTSPDGVNVFSLGQLTDADEARDAVNDPLNKQLAQNIVDYLVHLW